MQECWNVGMQEIAQHRKVWHFLGETMPLSDSKQYGCFI